MDAVAFPGLLPVDGVALRQRVRLAGLALVCLLGAIWSLVLLVVTTVAIGTTPVVAGGALLLGLVPLVAGATRVQRRMTGWVLGHELTARYAPAPREPVRRLGAWARDTTRWRDYAFLAYHGSGGLAMSAVVVGLTVAPVWYLAAPFVLGGGWWWLWLLAGPAAGLWWVLTPLLLRPLFLAGGHVLGWSPAAELEREVERVTASRAATVDSAAAELRRIANVVKRSGAARAWVTLTHDGGALRAMVGDDGRGGADPALGSGLAGLGRRVAAFDGTLTVSSPPGGPTTVEVEVEVPCALSSSRTTPYSGTA